jgi:hypothetical protein
MIAKMSLIFMFLKAYRLLGMTQKRISGGMIRGANTQVATTHNNHLSSTIYETTTKET